MKKTNANSNKATTKNQQKISSFFNIKTNKKNEPTTTSNGTKNKSPDNKIFIIDDGDDFEDDFKKTKKEKVNKLTLKNGKINSPKKCNKENKITRKLSTKTNTKSPPLIETQNNKQNDSKNSEESVLVVDLNNDDKNKKSNTDNDNIFNETPEKTFCKNDNVDDLIEPVKPIDYLISKNDIVKSRRKSSPPHSTPKDKMKNCKIQSSESPDIIPPTPQETQKMGKKRKSISIERKLSNIDEDIIPDMIVKKPPLKKRRSNDSSNSKTIINLSNISANEFDKIHALSIDSSNELIKHQLTPTKKASLNLVQSTSKFKVTPIKSISPSTKSPYKGNVTVFKVTPTKSKRVLFDKLELTKDSKEQTIDYPEDIVALSDDTTTVSINGLTKTIEKLETNDNIEVIKYLESNEKNARFELDQSNYIVTTILNTDEAKEKKDENDDLVNDFIFDDNWDEEIMNVEEKIELNLENWTYCRVLEVTKDFHQNLNVKLQSVKEKTETMCCLKEIWQNVRIQPGDLINIMAIKSSQDVGYFVDNNNGFVIYEPDYMVSPTSIVGFNYCSRKGILQEKFRGFDAENKCMIVGTLVHKLLEEVLKRKFYTSSLIEKKLIEILTSKNMITTLYSSQIPLDELKTELFPFIPKIVNFINKYILSEKKKSRYENRDNNDWKGAIHSIRDIEENIWCPELGIKGKVDITVNIDEQNQIVPLELKTGRATLSLEHRGQIILYIMMMNELGFNVSSGLLLYLREEKLKELKTNHREKRDLLMMRNEFTYFMKQKPQLVSDKEDANFDNKSVSSKSSITVMSENDPLRQLIAPELPEPIHNERACSKCPYALVCTAFLSRENEKISEKHPLKTISDEVLAHLKPNHIDYFLHWTSLITLENCYKPPMKELKDIWRLEPFKREQRNKSICYLNISEKVYEESDTYIHTFKRTTDINYLNVISEKKLTNDFLTCGLAAGNYVVLSTDTRVAIATGFVKTITEFNISVGLERNLTERYNNKIFHIDTYESVQIANFSMTSVAALIEPTEKAKRLRELIIDKEPSKNKSKFSAEASSIIRTPKAQAIIKRLNRIQQRAVLTAMVAPDYLLIKGMPGTGKTATIVALIQLLVMCNKSVLITSHTHSSVDNVCLRLLDSGVEFMRLGAESRIHPQLKHRSENALTATCKTLKDITDVYNKVQVVAVTCLAAGHPLLSQRNIDVCIVDESTQVLQCSVIKALLSTKSFVLIGDPDQLPPVVKNPEAVRRGMNESLFERLDNPQSTITLTLQYRMNKTITELANAVTYQSRLLCANDSIGYAILRLPKLERLLRTYGHDQWIITALDPKIENAVIAIDTAPTWNKIFGESENDLLLTEMQLAPQNVVEDEERKCTNQFECAIVVTIIKALKQAGVQSNTIGVIAPYRAQVQLLQKQVSKIDTDANSESVEVNTVDQYQGRDKDVIIYSCTRSRDTSKTKNNTGFEILDDKRRLTVAITRAKHKLILIGDFTTLKEYTPFNKLITSLQPHQILDVNDKKNSFDWDKVCTDMDV